MYAFNSCEVQALIGRTDASGNTDSGMLPSKNEAEWGQSSYAESEELTSGQM